MAVLIDDLVDIVGTANVLTRQDVVDGFVNDWTGRFSGRTPAVVRPADTAEVARIVQLCVETGTAIVPQGGNTGLVGGGVPLDGELVVSLRRLDSLGPVDRVGHQVTAGAGVTIEALQRHARASRLDYAIDLGSRGSSTVGGTIATNAGGVHVLRWGGTRAQVLGVEAVLGDGSVVSHLEGLVKDNTGYDLAALLCGSEGTLGLVTAARLRLVPTYEATVTALIAFESVPDAVAAVGEWRHRIECLDAAEIFFQPGLDLVESVQGLRAPFAERWPVYVLIQASAHRDPTDALAEAVGAVSSVRDVAVASDAGTRAELWRYREEHTLAINTLGAPHKLDVTLPTDALAAFIETVPGVVASVAPDAQTWLFGHVGDGNVHVNVTGVASGDESVDEVVLELVAAHHGSISAEHGIGRAKRRFLHLARSDAEVAAYRRIKAALDPAGILNPNVLIPPEAPAASPAPVSPEA